MKAPRLKIRYFLKLSVVVIAVLLVGAIFLFWVIEKNWEKSQADRVKTRALVIARAGALSISGFLKHREDKLLLMADVEVVQAEKEKEGREYLRKVIDQLQDYPFISIVRVNKEGKVLWSENKLHTKVEEGIDVSDRDYFLWAKEQGGPGAVFLGKPIIARGGSVKGEWAVVVATPVFYQEKFNGLIFISTPFNELTTKFITPLLVSPEAEVMMVASGGEVIASTNPEIVGENALDLFKGGEEEIRSSLGEREGSVIGYFSKPPSGKKAKTIVGYAPITRKGEDWSLWVFLPYTEVLNLFWPLRTGLIKVFLLMTFGFTILCVILVMGLRIAQREGFFDGYIRGRDGMGRDKG